MENSGLIADGVPAAKVKVVPYGCPAVTSNADAARERILLFVGQGVRRKGLHLLLHVWATIPHAGFRLRVVSNAIDPAMRPFISACDDLEFLTGLSNEEVRQEMADADTLVLPSLLEGFGLVLGEALSAGCRLLASSNTGLVDLDLAPACATVVEPASVEGLRAGLLRHMEGFDPRGSYRQECFAGARRNSWEAFRQGVRDAVEL